MTGSPKIAIIGAGPAGCMLARLLHRAGIETTVFEGEASPEFRTQGGTLDLHSDTGIAAMKEAGLFDKFKEDARYDGEYMAIVDKDLKYQFVKLPQQFKGSMGERPEIDRSSLRRILTQSLPEGSVEWGHRLQKVEDGKLVFEHKTIDGFDLVVGADGAWSKVRKAVAPDLELVYAGIAMHEFGIPDAEKTAPETYKLVNRGSVFASSDGHRLSIQQMGDGGLNIYASYVREDPDWMAKCGYNPRDLEEARAAMLEEHSDWHPELRNAFRFAQGTTTPRSLWILPPGSKWQHKSGLTLIGDAAHVMTPHAGEGVNQSLADALSLARAIIDAVKNGKDMDKEIEKSEKGMFARATRIQQLSYDITQYWYFTPGAPRSVMAKAISRHVNEKLPWLLQPLGTAGVYSFYFFKNLLT
ncbi:Tetracycline resistance protein from transposon [Paramyrothecium foliicola]|nr:Tetracycline resistance protein from transposon [Paramyrothecium foliicola]